MKLFDFNLLSISFLTWLSGDPAPTSPIILNPSSSGSTRNSGANLAGLSTQVMDFILSSYSEDGGRTLDYQSMSEDEDYKFNLQNLYDNLVQDPIKLTDQQRKTFFINLYNILVIDSVVNLVTLPDSTEQIPNFWRTFAYRINGINITLDTIQHGILRGNKPHRDSNVMIKENSPALQYILPFDVRTHFALNPGFKSSAKINSYSSGILDTQLDMAVKDFCEEGVVLVETGGNIRIEINSIFNWYARDFGATEKEVLQWIVNCTGSKEKKDALNEAIRGRVNFSYVYSPNLNQANTARSSKIQFELRNNSPL